MLGDVRQRLLCHPVDRQPGIGADRVLRARHREVARNAPAREEPRREAGQAFRSGDFVAAEHVDRLPGLVEAGLAHVLGAVDGVAEPRVGGRVTGGEHPGRLELEQQPGQRVRQHVVHLPGQPLAFG